MFERPYMDAAERMMEAALRAGRLRMCMNTVKRVCVCVRARACVCACAAVLSQSLSYRRALAPLPLTSHLPGGLPPADRRGLLLLPLFQSPFLFFLPFFFSVTSNNKDSNHIVHLGQPRRQYLFHFKGRSMAFHHLECSILKLETNTHTHTHTLVFLFLGGLSW